MYSRQQLIAFDGTSEDHCPQNIAAVTAVSTAHVIGLFVFVFPRRNSQVLRGQLKIYRLMKKITR